MSLVHLSLSLLAALYIDGGELAEATHARLVDICQPEKLNVDICQPEKLNSSDELAAAFL